MTLGLLVPSENVNKVYPGFLTLDHMGPPLKIKILKIGLRHVLSWPKLSLEPKCHDPGTFGGFGKCEHINTQDSCFSIVFKYRYAIHSKSLTFKTIINLL